MASELYAYRRSNASAEHAVELGLSEPTETDARKHARTHGLRVRKLRANAKGYRYHITGDKCSMWAANEREVFDLIAS